MASAQQLIGLIKSHAEGDEKRFFDLAMQLVAAEGSFEGTQRARAGASEEWETICPDHSGAGSGTT